MTKKSLKSRRNQEEQQKNYEEELRHNV